MKKSLHISYKQQTSICTNAHKKRGRSIYKFALSLSLPLPASNISQLNNKHCALDSRESQKDATRIILFQYSYKKCLLIFYLQTNVYKRGKGDVKNLEKKNISRILIVVVFVWWRVDLFTV